ncbi:AfsR/SARP family transcriptional regulator [Nocardiopsis nanhaiensis]
MRFGVLGSLAVWDSSGAQLPITESKVRALLANLLVHHGRPVSTDRLIEDLWEGNPPQRPLNTLQTKVSQLRKVLGAERVLRAPAGYRVRVGDGELDADRFRRAVEEGERAGEPGIRGRLFSEALDLWRGPAFSEFADAAFVRAEAARLDELRVEAAEYLAEARIGTEENPKAVAGLRELVEEHPLRERPHGLYMLALFRAGRQGDALQVFHDLRARLGGELGVDPGRALNELYASLLRQEPESMALPQVAESPRRDLLDVPEPPRSNLPSPPTGLIGRESEHAHVRGALSDRHGSCLVTLTGPGGVGKTRLAVDVAHALTEEFPDGTWIVELAGMDRDAAPSELAERVIAALGLCEGVPDSEFDLVKWLRETLVTWRTLLVLDNCEHVVDSVAELASALLEVDGVRLMVTTQEPLDVPGETVFPVAPLTLPGHQREPAEMTASSSAVRLFVERAVAASPGFALTGDNAADVAAICRRLDGIPLAIELVAARMRALTTEQVATGLDDRFALPTGPGRGRPTRQQTLRSMIDWSWHLLTEAERRVLRRLAVHRDGCTLDGARAVCAEGTGLRAGEGRAGSETRDVLDVLSCLVDRSLLVREGGRYRLLESVAAYCDERLNEAGELEEVRRRFVSFHVREAERQDQLLRAGRQGEARTWFDSETVNLRYTLELAVRGRDAETALRLVTALARYWRLRKRGAEAQRSLEAALRLEGGPPEERYLASGWLTAFQGGEPSDLPEPSEPSEHRADREHREDRVRSADSAGRKDRAAQG